MRKQRIRTTAAQLLALALTAAGVFGQTTGRKNISAAELVGEFKSTRVFWQQLSGH